MEKSIIKADQVGTALLCSSALAFFKAAGGSCNYYDNSLIANKAACFGMLTMW
jgi:hypothetical protein